MLTQQMIEHIFLSIHSSFTPRASHPDVNVGNIEFEFPIVTADPEPELFPTKSSELGRLAEAMQVKRRSVSSNLDLPSIRPIESNEGIDCGRARKSDQQLGIRHRRAVLWHQLDRRGLPDWL